MQLHATSLKCEALRANGPPPTARHAHAAAVVGGRLFVSGGLCKLTLTLTLTRSRTRTRTPTRTVTLALTLTLPLP